jgi:LmbE family N-acetylglucosaminyl deacetylase
MRVVYIFAHQDDELSAWPLIRAYRSRGAQQIFIFMTDSAAGGDVGTRQRETIKALKEAGITEPDCRFAGAEEGFPDGQLWKYLPCARDALRAIVLPLAPDVIVTHALEGGHPDHDTSYALTCWLLRQLLKAPEAYQVAIYNMRNRRWPFFRAADPIPENGLPIKARLSASDWGRFALAARHYPSQRRVLAALWPAVMWTCLRRRGFYYQSLIPDRIAARPHPGPLMYEQRRGDRSAATFSDVHKSVTEALR